MQNASSIFRLLKKEYVTVKTPLNYETPIQLLVAVILSAQCTDERVNKVTPALFDKYSDAKSLARADIKDMELLVKSTGFFRSKAKNIIASSAIIMQKHKGLLPQTIAELIELPGVGRKTANVILRELFNRNEGVVVDTHVGRLAVRIGLTKAIDSKNAKKIEQDLMTLFPKSQWGDISLYLIFHGRRVCTAKAAYCDDCIISKYCRSARKISAYKPSVTK